MWGRFRRRYYNSDCNRRIGLLATPLHFSHSSCLHNLDRTFLPSRDLSPSMRRKKKTKNKIDERNDCEHLECKFVHVAWECRWKNKTDPMRLEKTRLTKRGWEINKYATVFVNLTACQMWSKISRNNVCLWRNSQKKKDIWWSNKGQMKYRQTINVGTK